MRLLLGYSRGKKYEMSISLKCQSLMSNWGGKVGNWNSTHTTEKNKKCLCLQMPSLLPNWGEKWYKCDSCEFWLQLNFLWEFSKRSFSLSPLSASYHYEFRYLYKYKSHISKYETNLESSFIIFCKINPKDLYLFAINNCKYYCSPWIMCLTQTIIFYLLKQTRWSNCMKCLQC